MAAPTPVSAYLHSATMVKAGIFLMARLWPVLAGTPEWFWIVTTAGLVTMLLGAKVALFKHDLKAILAFSTVSHLGLITMLLGFGTTKAAVIAVFHIINHATFKAALFMAAGIVDHETHTRDIRRLGGLRHLMPVTFAITAVAALSMAGIPPLNGFLSKEMMLEETVHAGYGPVWLLPLLATLGALTSVAYSFRLVAHGFMGPARNDYPHHPHDPGFGMWAAPALLALLVVLVGLFPMTMSAWLVQAAADAVTGTQAEVYIKHWHGLGSPALWMSVVAVAGGALVLSQHARFQRMWDDFPRPEAKEIFDALVGRLAQLARLFTDRSHSGRFGAMMATGTLAIVAAGLWAFAGGTHAAGLRAPTPVGFVPAAGFVALALAIGATLLWHRNRLLSLVLVGIVGLVISVGFAWLSAPDLALTQITVEVVTIVLMLLALNYLPKETPRESSPARRWRDGAIAGAAGLGMAALAYAIMIRDFAFPSISGFHLAQSKPGAGGTNSVNTIIVDFRGYDTFGEITVLGIAALLIYALVETILKGGAANDRLLAWQPDSRRAADRHPMMLVVATRLLLPIILMVGVYLYLRGHNMPGGGFVAGLVVAIALVMQYMASGFAWAERRQRIDHHGLIAAGVLIAAATGIGAWFNEMPFLTSAFAYVHLWPLEEFELATAALFDLGVFLTVLGSVMLALASLSRIGLRAGQTENRRAFDAERPTGPEAN
jgi:multicomponent K+:H+ antiporter subunit A